MTVISEEAEDEAVEEQAEAASEADTNQECKYIECEGVKITFLPLNSLPDMAKKSWVWSGLLDVFVTWLPAPSPNQ